MTFCLLRRAWLLLALCGLSGCAPGEPINGCMLAAANRREVLRAQTFLHPTITARIAGVHFVGVRGGHAMLVYRLDGGWWAYDDVCGSRSLRMTGPDLPDPIKAAAAAFPGHPVFFARWLDPAR